MLKSWSEGSVDSEGVAIHYYRTGSGELPALVCAHGFTDNGLCFSRLAGALQHRFDVVMVDARNHGKSGTAAADVLSLAGDLAEVVRSLELVPVAVLGHSVGASVAATFAAEHSQLVSKLVLEDPPWRDSAASAMSDPAKSEAFKQYVRGLEGKLDEEILSEGRAAHSTWHAGEFKHWVESNRQVRAQAMELLDLGDWRDAVRELQCPTLLLYGDADKGGIVNLRTAQVAAQMNELLLVRHVPGGGHNLRREAFDGFLAAVADFLGVAL